MKATEKALQSEIDPQGAVKVVKSLVEALHKSGKNELTVTIHAHDENVAAHENTTSALGLPCIVCVKTPFFSKCLVPPGGDC